MQPKLTLLTFALLTLAAAAAACESTPAESFRDFEGGTGGESGSDTGGLDIICVSDEDGVTAEREYGEGCPMDYTLGCVASEYPDPTSGAACCKLFEESNCHMNWGESTCSAGFVRVCAAAAPEIAPMQLCGSFTILYQDYSGVCDANTEHVCWEGEYIDNLGNGSASACCAASGDPGSCELVAWGTECLATQWHVCDVQ
jgi:hypothetical protein